MVAWPRAVAMEEKGDGRVNMSILDMMELDGWLRQKAVLVSCSCVTNHPKLSSLE